MKQNYWKLQLNYKFFSPFEKSRDRLSYNPSSLMLFMAYADLRPRWVSTSASLQRFSVNLFTFLFFPYKVPLQVKIFDAATSLQSDLTLREGSIALTAVFFWRRFPYRIVCATMNNSVTRAITKWWLSMCHIS